MTDLPNELERLNRMAAAAEAFSYWRSSAVSQTPSVTLADWRVMQLADGSRYLLGTNLTEGGSGRISTPLVDLNLAQGIATTQSGRVYALQGPPGRTDNSDYVWQRWLADRGNPPWADITDAVLQESESP